MLKMLSLNDKKCPLCKFDLDFIIFASISELKSHKFEEIIKTKQLSEFRDIHYFENSVKQALSKLDILKCQICSKEFM